ncbi:hydantoinase/oxoprolinase family protein [Streptomyces sp. LZ34]
MPLVNLHTIGAGGGSIAYAEAGGLRVGPESAGAVPGPACYGRGGTRPTVTDANAVLGRVDAEWFAGGHMTSRKTGVCTTHRTRPRGCAGRPGRPLPTLRPGVSIAGTAPPTRSCWRRFRRRW